MPAATSNSIKGPLLTIGIPVFNGMEYLVGTLESVLANCRIFDIADLEVLISDNASTDRTPEIALSYVDQYPTLFRYSRNETNLGYDRNVDTLFRKARGQFLHILGDDDFYQHEGCVARIIHTLRTVPDLRTLLLSIELLDIPTNERIRGTVFSEDHRHDSGDDFFSATLWGTAAVSSLVISVAAWNQSQIDRYFGTQWVHVGAVLSILKGRSVSFVLAEPLVVVRYRNKRWETNGNQLELGIKHLAVLSMMIGLGYRQETFELFLKDRYSTNLEAIRNLRPRSFTHRIRIAGAMAHLFGKYASFWFSHLPALVLPEFVLAPFRLAIGGVARLKELAKRILRPILRRGR